MNPRPVEKFPFMAACGSAVVLFLALTLGKKLVLESLRRPEVSDSVVTVSFAGDKAAKSKPVIRPSVPAQPVAVRSAPGPVVPTKEMQVVSLDTAVPAPGAASKETPKRGSEMPGAEPIAPPEQTQIQYEVRPGDTVQKIAKSFLGSQGSYTRILDANPGLDARRIRPGMKITVPVKSGQSPRKVLELDMQEARKRTYVVRKGDSLSVIAQRECGSVKELRRIQALNPGLDGARLKAGAAIFLPPARERI